MENETQIGTTQVESSPAMGFGGKLINIFTSPSKTFAELRERPSWLAPMILFILITIIITQISFPVIMSSQLEKFRSNPNIPAERMQLIETQLTEKANTQRAITVGSQVIGTPIVFLFVSFIFYLMGTAILGGDSSFKKVLSVWSWSNCISILGVIIGTVLVMAKGSLDVSLSPAILLSADAVGTKLYTFLSKFDFFTIWLLAVFAIGFGSIYRFSMAKAFTAVGVVWAIWIGISVALSGVFRQFGF